MISRRTLLISAVLIAAVALVWVAVFVPHAAGAKQRTIEVKWLIAHEPVSLFDRAAQDFATQFNKDGDGTIHITILSPKDFGSTNGHLPTDTVLHALNDGSVQMATVVVGSLSAKVPKLQIMNLPYLFNDYPSAEKVFDGPVGGLLLKIIDDNTETHALALTFSGGFVVLDSNKKEIRSANDVRGLKIGTIDGPMAMQILSAYGASPVSMDRSVGAQQNAAELDSYDAMELPYTRIFPELGQHPKYIAETYHSVFTTAILSSDSFFASLSDKNKAALQKAALLAAQDERADSIALGMKHRQQLIDAGTVITSLATGTIETLKTEARPVYDAYESTYGTDLVQSIVAAQR